MKCKIKNKVVLIDDEDLGIFNRYNWHISDSGYVVWRGLINGKKKTIRLHRLVMHADEDQIVDHINRNKLDNRKSNLRFTTCAENLRNTSQYEKAKCYYYDNTKQRWTIDAKRFGIKSLYMDSEEACIKYIDALKKGERPIRQFTRRIPKAKLGDRVDYILNEKKKGRSDMDIANEIGVSYSAVHRVVIGQSFSDKGRVSRRTGVANGQGKTKEYIWKGDSNDELVLA